MAGMVRRELDFAEKQCLTMDTGSAGWERVSTGWGETRAESSGGKNVDKDIRVRDRVCTQSIQPRKGEFSMPKVVDFWFFLRVDGGFDSKSCLAQRPHGIFSPTP